MSVRACPGCGSEVRLLRPTCRACGALLIAPPAPAAVSTGTAGSVGAPTAAPTAEEQFFAPAVLQPIVRLPPSSNASGARSASGSGISVGGDAGKWIVLAAMLLFFTAAVATAYFTLKPAAKGAQTPEVLAPRTPTEGLPSGLGTVVRMQAESARRTALQTAEELGSGDLARLAAAQPGFQWVAGDRPSTDAHTVSVAPGVGVVTIAVAASNHDVCAFGQWTIGAAARYVTMGHQPVCAAINAPAEGWSSEPGGAASDLPDDPG